VVFGKRALALERRRDGDEERLGDGLQLGERRGYYRPAAGKYDWPLRGQERGPMDSR